MKETVNHPSHYGGDVPHEVIKCLEAWGLEKDALLWNAVKYIARAGKKSNELEDLRKAEFYLRRRIATMEKTEHWQRGVEDFGIGKCDVAGKAFFELDENGKQYFLGWNYAQGRAGLKREEAGAGEGTEAVPSLALSDKSVSSV
jgi:hypothetical protein